MVQSAASGSSTEGIWSRLLVQPPRQLKKLNFQAVLKSAASAASLDLQGSPRTTARHADGGARGLPCKSREAALAADLITA